MTKTQILEAIKQMPNSDLYLIAHQTKILSPLFYRFIIPTKI